jgi:choline dehydrogenase-like flavoprotein
MRPTDFKTKSKYGHGEDWPISYDELEPYYGRAETLIGVSGTDEDNPFAPPRTTPFPLPPFALSYDDNILRERLAKAGITIHTTPQARTRLAYDGRPGCMNFGVCPTCPVGVRYSPTHHLNKALATGRCTLRTDTSVRRILLDSSGRARALVVRGNSAAKEEEHAAKVIIVAAGALESTRLLLLSEAGNAGGQVGRGLTFHHYHTGSLRYPEALFPGRLGPQTAQSQQFTDPETRGKHGGIKIDFHSWPAGGNPWELMKRTHPFGLHSESVPDAKKYVVLSEQKDRFGDPFAHLHYDSAPFDYATHEWGKSIFDKFAKATGAEEASVTQDPNEFSSGAHHMGTCRMGTDAKDSVVDVQCRVHGSPNLFVVGGAAFVGGSGAVHPTLTMAALAIRAADFMMRELIGG